MGINNKDFWANLKGGYKIPYDASVPLNKLRMVNDPQLISNIFNELWKNLHHQGDLGLASYYSVPQLVEICIDKKSFDWNFVGLLVLIENRRLSNNNPILPKDLEHDYFDALNKFAHYLLTNFKRIQDKTALRFSLSLFATLNGQRELGQAIEQLDEDEIKEFLNQF